MQIQIQIQAVVRWQWYDSPWHSPRDKGSALRPSLQLHSTQLLDLFHNQANNDSQVLFNSTLPNSWKSPLCNPPTLHLCRSNISIQYWRRSPPSHYFVFETLRTASHYLKLVCCLLFFIYGRGQLTYCTASNLLVEESSLMPPLCGNTRFSCVKFLCLKIGSSKIDKFHIWLYNYKKVESSSLVPYLHHPK